MRVDDIADQFGIAIGSAFSRVVPHQGFGPQCSQGDLAPRKKRGNTDDRSRSLTLAEGKTKAIRFIFAGCCARAASGHVAAVPSAAMKSRRLIGPPEGMLPWTSAA